MYYQVGFNSQPPEGGWFAARRVMKSDTWVSTHSRPKAAGWMLPPDNSTTEEVFQLTAARRRLAVRK